LAVPTTPGKCLFCGEPGRRTKSHIWPEWSQQVVSTKATHYELLIGKTAETFETKALGPDKFYKRKPGSAVKRQPRNTCESCNSGWMRRIEEAARPAITKLMLGHDFILETLNQRLVASFLCLVSMRLEGSGEMRTIHQSDREKIRREFVPGSSWWIAITRYQDDDPHDYWSGYWGMQISESSQPKAVNIKDCNTQVSTILAGKMCAHMFSSTVWYGFRGYQGAALTQLWPPTRFDIATGAMPYIDNKGLPWLHEAVARDGTARS
jgi:hypothetical protein